MTRQAQNMILGGLAFAVGIVAIAAVFLLVTGDGSTTTAGAPFAPAVGETAQVEGSTDGVSTSAGDTLGSARPPLQPLAVPMTSAAEVDQTTTMVITTTTIATTTTTAAKTTTTEAATTTTEAPATTAAETTAAESTAETTTAPDSTEAPDTSMPAESDPEPETSTPSTQAPAPSSTEAPAPTPTQPPVVEGLNDIEREIARMTNELRTNPNGPLRREGPVINCDGRVLVSNGRYDSIGALQVSEVASLAVARPWSAQMTRSNFKHQTRAGVPALEAAGIQVRSAGENIAYHSYADKARVHFEGWRESDGHFCNMMDPGFTHIGVGEVSKPDGISYATQNFFSTR